MNKIVSPSYLLKIFLITMLFIGLFLPDYCFAQTKKVTPKPEKTYWHMDFTVTIKGEGKQTNEDEDYITEWIVDRTYSGVIKLNDSIPWYKPGLSTQENMEAVKSHRFTAFQSLPSDITKNNWTPLNIQILDRYRVTILDNGEGRSFENTKMLKTWKFNSDMSGKKAFVPNAVQLSTDSKLRTYNVFIPILAAEGFKEHVSLFLDTIIDRSSFGYGDAPTHEEKPVQLLLVSIHSLGVPTVKGLIENGAIQHIPNDFLLPANFTSSWGYDSFDDLPNLQPDQPIFPGVPDSKTKVNIRVRYRFSKTPFY